MPREGHPETPGADGLPGKRSRPANVLVVSSNYVECRRLARQLRELGCLAQTSEHAPDALHRMRLAIQDGMPFSSVIADEGLTGVDAVSFAHLVRKEPELENVQLLLLARRPKPDFEHYKEAGYTGQVDLRVDGALLARPLQESDPAPSETRRPAADPARRESRAVADLR